MLHCSGVPVVKMFDVEIVRMHVQVGWPLTVPSNERHIFARKVVELKERALKEMAKNGDIPLRPGNFRPSRFYDSLMLNFLCLICWQALPSGYIAVQSKRLLLSSTQSLKPVIEAQILCRSCAVDR